MTTNEPVSWRVSGISLAPGATPEDALAAALRAISVSAKSVCRHRVTRLSVDARDQGDVRLIWALDIDLHEACTPRTPKKPMTLTRVTAQTPAPAARRLAPPNPPPVVVGLGPCGLFAALELAERGLCPVVLERGGDVDARAEAREALFAQGTLNPENNLLFGEGGAGAFSDGKLTTGIKDLRCARVLRTLVAYGAPPEIEWLAKPHIGTDRLPGVVRAIREQITASGGQVRFGARVLSLITKNGVCAGVRYTQGGQTLEQPASAVILAIGHSARDTVEALYASGIRMEAKAFSIGARMEHPQSCIDRAQYGAFAGHPGLPPADYKLAVHLPDGRGAYTFCMCPGGMVVPASSEPGLLAVNGASAYARDGENANAALLISCTPSDFGSDHPLAGIELQRRVERAAYTAGGGRYIAPAQRVCDFLAGMASSTLKDAVRPTYLPGVLPGDMRAVLPDFAVAGMRKAIRMMDARLRGFASPGALITAPETRSSSPVRIPRGEDGQSVSLPGLYPGGEGAGYAGGIMSAAADGIRLAENVMEAV